MGRRGRDGGRRGRGRGRSWPSGWPRRFSRPTRHAACCRPTIRALVGLPPHVPEAGALWDEADVGAGDRQRPRRDDDPELGACRAPPKLVAVNVDAADATKNYGAGRSSSRATREAVAGALAERAGRAERPWTSSRRGWRRLRKQRARALGGASSASRAAAFLDACRGCASPDDAIVVCDMCIPGYWLGGFHPRARAAARSPTRWVGGRSAARSRRRSASALGGPGPAVAVSAATAASSSPAASWPRSRRSDPPLTARGRRRRRLRDAALRPGADRGDAVRRRPPHARLRRPRPELRRAAPKPSTAWETRSPPRWRAMPPIPSRSVLVARAALQPPPTTSPRWYRHR